MTPFATDFLRVSNKDVEKGDKSKAKYGVDFLKPVDMVHECTKAIDEMDANARGRSISSRGPVPVLVLQGLYKPENALFLQDTSKSADTVLAFAVEEGFIWLKN